jgi:hypothetical protein
MSQTITVLWAILLIVTVLLLPVIVTLLHRTWKAARSIERYLAEMLEAGIGIAENTGHIEVLNDTEAVAGDILETAGEINSNTQTIEQVLGERAEKLNE